MPRGVRSKMIWAMRTADELSERFVRYLINCGTRPHSEQVFR